MLTVYPVSEGSILNTSMPIVIPTMTSPSAQNSKQNVQITTVQPPNTVATANYNDKAANLTADGDSVTIQHYLLTSIVTNTSTGKQTSQLITQPIILPQSDSAANQSMVLVPNIHVPVDFVPLNTPLSLAPGSTSAESTPSNADDGSVGVPVEILVSSSNAGSAQTGAPAIVASSNTPVVVSSSSLVTSAVNDKERVPVKKSVKKLGGASNVDLGFTGEYVLLAENETLAIQNETNLDTSSKSQGQPKQTTLDASSLLPDSAQDGKIMNVISLTDLLTPIDMTNFTDAGGDDKDQSYTEMTDQSVDVRDFLSAAVSKELSEALEESNDNLPLIENE